MDKQYKLKYTEQTEILRFGGIKSWIRFTTVLLSHSRTQFGMMVELRLLLTIENAYNGSALCILQPNDVYIQNWTVLLTTHAWLAQGVRRWNDHTTHLYRAQKNQTALALEALVLIFLLDFQINRKFFIHK